MRWNDPLSPDTIIWGRITFALGLIGGVIIGLLVGLAISSAEAQEEPNRASCNEIRGTEYWSWAERDWWKVNCETPVRVHALGAAPSIQDAFYAGWLAGGGAGALIPVLGCIIQLESGWNPYNDNPEGPYYGLGQFLLSTWLSVGGGDLRDPWTQGRNMAVNWLRSGPEGQWPAAYRRCA